MDFDAIVVGSGAGGGAAAAELARAGRRVLVVERGRRLERPAPGAVEPRQRLERDACDERPVELNGRIARLVMGGVAGGGTALFGAALLRPGPSDFTPGRFYAEHLPRAQWEWPLDLAELSPWLDRAEDLFAVAGDHRAELPHLDRRLRPYPRPSPPLEPFSRHLSVAFRAAGLRPFALPLAIDFARCLGCGVCPGASCPTGARASSLSHALEPAAREARLTLWTEHEAERLALCGRRADGLWLRDRRSGQRALVRARAYLVAAGAIGTPALLLRSGVRDASDQLGRNHMCHLGALALALHARPTEAAHGFHKRLGLTDFYLGTPDFPHKLGYAQFLPIPGAEAVRDELALRLPLGLARALYARAWLFAGSIEDLPQPGNRVTLGPDGGIRLARRFHAYDRARGRRLARALRRLVGAAGASLAVAAVAHRSHGHAAHQVGTARFGRDPRTSVVDAQCRLHGYDDVYVVDGSVLPTSLGVGPALTIAANALRVGAHVAKEVA